MRRTKHVPECERDGDWFPVIVAGPVVNGFFIHNTRLDVWDGENWRGFGMPRYFDTFLEAFAVARKMPGHRRAIAESIVEHPSLPNHQDTGATP